MRHLVTISFGIFLGAVGAGGVGCSGAPCTSDLDCLSSPATPVCGGKPRVCQRGGPRATLIGSRDGSAGSVTFTPVFEPEISHTPTGLAFNPSHPEELWIVNYLDNTVYTVLGVGTPEMNHRLQRDPAANHFMNRPTGISFA